MPRTPTPDIGPHNRGDRIHSDIPHAACRSRLDTLTALRALAAGRKIPGNKYQMLIRVGMVKLRGHGGKKTPVLTGRGTDVLRGADLPAQ